MPFSAQDLADWKAHYGASATLSASSTAVPEPACFVLAVASALGIGWIRARL